MFYNLFKLKDILYWMLQKMSSLNPFKDIPAILTAEEIIEYAHKHSKKLSMKSSYQLPKVDRTRIREVARLQEFVKLVKTKLKQIVEEFPSLDNLHPFYIELAEILVGIDKLKRSLGAVYNCIGPINDIADNHLEAIKLSKDYKQMKWSRSAAKGRIASIVESTSENIDFIIHAKTTLSKLPGILPDSPTIVCAGFPNVGKSTLVRQVSTAEPEIAYYPFTTKKVIIGHLKIGEHLVQIVDTPGVLDRPMSKRNDIEKQAITALKYLADVIVFLIDPSEACGWNIRDQMGLLNEVRRTFPLVPTLTALNKVDITPEDKLKEAHELLPNVYEISALSGDGVGVLLRDATGEVDVKTMDEAIEEYLESIKKGDPNPFD